MNIKKATLAVGVIFTIIGLIAGLVISSNLNIQVRGYTQEPGISKESIDILSKTGQAMAEVTAAVKPSVVNISSTRTVKTGGIHDPFFDDPFFRRFFRDEFGPSQKPREHKQASLGSGVIVDKDGYILTNNHVIKDADEIKVKLSDKREFKGKVIGSDPKTDIAVIKIDSNHLPVLKWGDSDKLKVGETVIAIGNPFGLSQTVTSGIVSAIGRADVGIADYEDFIQTDAAINPGNSGGALVNIRGELVGINTAIFSTSGGYQGIGFAIPSSMAKIVMENLVRKGKVVRGWLGVSIQPVTPELARQFGIKEEKGVLVGDVVEESPAERAGLRRGDVITEFDGREVNDPSHLRIMAANTPPDRTVIIKLLRDGKPSSLSITIAEFPSDMQKVSGHYENLLKGLHVQWISPEIRKNLNIPRKVTGVIITEIEDGSPSEGALAVNDVIMEVNRKKVESIKDFEAMVSKIKPDQNILLLIFRNGSAVYVTISAR